MEWFLEHICNNEWNLELDKGYPFEQGVVDLKLKHPEYSDQIEAYHKRWPEMLGGEIRESVEILEEIQAKKYKVYGLTNWSMETFPIAFGLYPFLGTMDGIVVSGAEKIVKPEPAIYHLISSRYQLAPETTLFIDDNQVNIMAAKALGFQVIHFLSPRQLKDALRKFSVL